MSGLSEPAAPDPAWPRYSSRPLPPYRFVPGLNAHPRSHPEGHMFGLPDPLPPPWSPREWRTLDPYLHGVDLYNFAFWWEAHETLEGLWKAAGRLTEPAQFLQGIIQVSAAHLNRHLGRIDAARRQVREGLGRLEGAPLEAPRYMGLDAAMFSRQVGASFDADAGRPVLIRLDFDAPGRGG